MRRHGRDGRGGEFLWGRSRTARALDDLPATRSALETALTRYRELATSASLTAAEEATRRQVEKDLAALSN